MAVPLSSVDHCAVQVPEKWCFLLPMFTHSFFVGLKKSMRYTQTISISHHFMRGTNHRSPSIEIVPPCLFATSDIDLAIMVATCLCGTIVNYSIPARCSVSTYRGGWWISVINTYRIKSGRQAGPQVVLNVLRRQNYFTILWHRRDRHGRLVGTYSPSLACL